MGLFDKVFGRGNNGGKASPPPPPKPSGGSGGGRAGVAESMENLDGTIDLLDKREQVLEKKIEQEIAKAKECLAKNNKSAAMQCMKRKKMYEDQIVKIQAQKDNMETMRFALQEQAMNREVLEAQRRAGHQLETLNAGMNADRVEDDMDRLRDAMDMAADVTNALTQPIDNNVVDEDELMDELNMLAGETPTATQKTTAGPIPSELTGVTVPSGNLPVKKPVVQEEEDEEAALRALEAELNA